jgi:hypothetical protein
VMPSPIRLESLPLSSWPSKITVWRLKETTAFASSRGRIPRTRISIGLYR